MFVRARNTHAPTGGMREAPKGGACYEPHLHHTSRENAHNTSSNVRVRPINGSPVTVPVRALLTVQLVRASAAEGLQFVFFAEGRRRGCRIVGADNDVDDVIGWVGVDVGAQQINVGFVAFQLEGKAGERLGRHLDSRQLTSNCKYASFSRWFCKASPFVGTDPLLCSARVFSSLATCSSCEAS